MTEPATIRHPVWHGVQPIAALWFAHDTLGADARIARLFAEWMPGAQALRFPEGDVLLFAEPRLRRCDDCPGLPLCRVGGVLASGPLASDERRALAGADLGIVTGARLVALRRADGVAIDLDRHLDLDDYALHDTYDLAESLPPPATGRLAGKHAREALGGAVPPSSAERDAVLDALARRDAGKGRRWRGAIDGAAGGGSLVIGALRRLFAKRPVPNTGGVAPRAPTPAHASWRDAAARLAMLTRASWLIGRRQAQHLARLLRQFEDGNLDEALRNALPLAGDDGANPQSPAFGWLSRRADLRLSARASGGGSSIAIGDALMEHLRKLYRRAFEKLDRAGRVDEAAFVLAELLDAKAEALDYLVKHDRAMQAAELALGWDMPAAMIVRLLLAAGDAPRAVQVARRDNAFAAAVAQLEPQHAEHARLLRREWGRALVAQGDWLGAVDAIWPLTDLRELAAAWLLAAETAGVELSARALVRRAILLPETLDDHAERIEALAEPGNAAARTAVAQAILDHRQRGDGVRRLAAWLLPAVAGDRAAGANALNRDALDRLASLAGSATLSADLPRWQLPPISGGGRLIDRATPLALPLPAAGLHAVYDAARLRDDRWLVALGEAGVAVVDASGRLLQRFAAPAMRLVIATSRNVALALAPRGNATALAPHSELMQISRLDLVRHTIVDLGVMRVSAYSGTFDGIAWNLVSGVFILVIDTTTPAREVLWQVPDQPRTWMTSAYSATSEAHLLRTTTFGEQPEHWECWRYQLPGRRLAQRADVSVRGQAVLHPQGVLLERRYERAVDGHLELIFHWQGAHRVALGVVPEVGYGVQYVCLDDALVITLKLEDSCRHFFVRLSNGACIARIDWPGATSSVREHDGHLLIVDEQGRLLDIDLANSLCRAISVI
ncbi:bpX6 domain-containing protein [Tahibacter soli]|uniref:BpX6 domain-containing protein n=1 Tax=Tahibacter soli TaxID=2983605 RepID=A0A9X4BIH3_9GAMM|nr:bpX6 domain-containing protein [Tahibacter soli]MDC8013991.1 bpX6 domain-containing protein [Tahibacter soli]